MTPHSSQLMNETDGDDLPTTRTAQHDVFVDAHLPGNDSNDEDQPRNDDALAPVVPRRYSRIGQVGVGPC